MNQQLYFTIRKAELTDMPTLLQFEQGVVEAERPFTPKMKPGPAKYYDMQELLTAPHIMLLVAELDGELVGSGYARIEESKHYLSHPRQAYLGFMYVVPQQRGKGVNSMILSALREWAHSKDVTELRLEVYSKNTIAIKAYEKAGFSSYLLQMRAETLYSAT
jgi:ribosomal protein S18 acetylase RimI-like enzyme